MAYRQGCEIDHLSLFSGIGGIDLAATWAGFRTVGFCESNPFCQRVLAKNFPGVKIHNDVTTLSGDCIVRPGEGRLTLMSAGFPCQPVSDAGNRQGDSDDRWLFPHVVRLLKDLQPLWFLGENVGGLLSANNGRLFGDVLRDLDEAGYRVGWTMYGAYAVGAPHERDRVFIIAHSKSQRPRSQKPLQTTTHSQGLYSALDDWSDIRDAFTRDRQSFVEWGANCPTWFLRGNDGVPPGVDALGALGNAVSPQQVYPILKAIADFEMGLK